MPKTKDEATRPTSMSVITSYCTTAAPTLSTSFPHPPHCPPTHPHPPRYLIKQHLHPETPYSAAPAEPPPTPSTYQSWP
jgi:hypothetical protein